MEILPDFAISIHRGNSLSNFLTPPPYPRTMKLLSRLIPTALLLAGTFGAGSALQPPNKPCYGGNCHFDKCTTPGGCHYSGCTGGNCVYPECAVGSCTYTDCTGGNCKYGACSGGACSYTDCIGGNCEYDGCEGGVSTTRPGYDCLFVCSFVRLSVVLFIVCRLIFCGCFWV